MRVCKVTKRFSIDYAHRLMHHNGKCRNLHGHTGIVEVSVIGEVDPRTGMVVDFSMLKDVCEIVHNNLDHSTILNEHDTVFVDLFVQRGIFRYVILSEEPTAENIAYFIKNKLEKHWAHLRELEIEAAEEDGEIGEDELDKMKGDSKNNLKFVVRFYETPDNFVETA